MNAEYQRLEAEASEVQNQTDELLKYCEQMVAADFQKFDGSPVGKSLGRGKSLGMGGKSRGNHGVTGGEITGWGWVAGGRINAKGD